MTRAGAERRVEFEAAADDFVTHDKVLEALLCEDLGA